MQYAEPARATAVRSPAVLRRCACGGGGGALGECAACRRARRRDATLRRQESDAKPKSNEEKVKEAAKKTGEAFLETSVGKDLKKKAEELGKGFVSSLAGKVITGAAAAGVVTYIVAKNKELPVGVPDIPLDVITPGLKATITYEGPVRSPTKAMVTFTWSPGAPAKKPSKQPTEKEKFRAETARMAKEQADFRESMKSPAERAEEKEMFWKAYWGGMGKYGIKPLNIPALDQEKKEEGTIRRSAEGESPAVAPPAVHETLARGGDALPAEIRSRFETRFGHDFGHVRIHTDTRAADSAAQVGARAYTAGDHVVFGAGTFSPRSPAGERLLAHELAHVVQQDSGRDTGGTGAGLAVGRADDPQEAAAESLARQALHGGVAAARPAAARSAGPALRREGDGGSGSGGKKDEKKKEPELRTSTPRISGSKVGDDGAQQLSVGRVNVLIKPDVKGDASVKGGGTTGKVVVQPKDFEPTYELDANGRIKSFEAPEEKVSLTVQTTYGVGIDPAGKSSYGRGTTKEDVAAGTTSLKFHEGQHGADYVQYLKAHPFPTFGGRKGMTLAEFKAALDAYIQATDEYGTKMDDAVLQSGDCVGISIDEHHKADPKWKPVCASEPASE